MRDLILQVVGIQDKHPQIKLSERIADLNLGFSFKEKLNNCPNSSKFIIQTIEQISDETDNDSEDFDEHNSAIIPYL